MPVARLGYSMAHVWIEHVVLGNRAVIVEREDEELHKIPCALGQRPYLEPQRPVWAEVRVIRNHRVALVTRSGKSCAGCPKEPAPNGRDLPVDSSDALL